MLSNHGIIPIGSKIAIYSVRSILRLVKICVAGAINWDINLFVERFPQIGEEVPIKRITRVPGGKAANVAVASVRILGSGKTALLGCLGKDKIAKVQREILEDEGVNISGITVTEDAESGQAYIIIDKEGRNFINTMFGANLMFSPQNLKDPLVSSLVYSSSVIILIDPPLETIEAAASLSHRYKKTVIWDAGVRSGVGVEKLEKILKNLDYVVVNQVEVNNLTGEESAEEAWTILSNANNRLKLIVKLGERGSLLISPDKKIEVPGVNLNELNLQVVNTVGCGDSFLGVFGAYKSLRLNDREALERANLAGALKATQLETRGSPTKQTLENFLKYRQQAIETKRPQVC